MLFGISCILYGCVVGVKIGMLFEGKFNCVDGVFSADSSGHNVVGKCVGQGM